ncbi:hypothetical protein SDC9_121078 [bioreactor metagenome]|uniref:Uncharacterized protein n=1 Tax=bioreactor metagenome TaxID=1076179 RepID=A0A645CAY1_9ZZZZ
MLTPLNISNSVSFGVNKSTFFIISSLSLTAGAGFNIVNLPSSFDFSKAYFIVSIGVSSCITTVALSFIASIHLSISVSVNLKFAPGETTIAFSAFSSTVIRATPLGPSSTCTYSVFTLSAFNCFNKLSPKPSFPTLPIIYTSPPSLDAATAWFPPFPPGISLNLLPIKV